MTYTPTYTSDDVAALAIDGVGKGLVAVVGLVAVIVLVAGFVWLRNALR